MIKPIRQDIVGLLQKLVRTNSVALPPEGCEAPVQKILEKFLKRYKLEVEQYDTELFAEERSSSHVSA